MQVLISELTDGVDRKITRNQKIQSEMPSCKLEVRAWYCRGGGGNGRGTPEHVQPCTCGARRSSSQKFGLNKRTSVRPGRGRGKTCV